MTDPGGHRDKPISEEAFDALFRACIAPYADLPGPLPSFPLGNAGAFLHRSPDLVCAEWAAQYGGAALIWLAASPGLLVSDPDLIE